ncbi:DoxX family protein [Gloeocapsopsis dulcis]|uniref:DoxX family protein n=1 Tax=Gloeocapsopsis dulcis AAB1 = 1H9 TaxID=1433147 RepID=A0A6N8G781_9CHRO|nr:DoxX family protein [Gloeocapsopsis dulcis]MUL39416.1 DoxX family protein [Gloeocapsopsis dulcis AAB1 = 1H9]WNN91695.1 DoxX family protein [Gloeocapsopsis dulcis]
MNYIPLAARVFLSVIFLRSGINKILDFAGTQEFMASTGIPAGLTGFLLVGSIILELLGALSVILGYKARWGAIALIVFLVPTTLLFHTNFAEDMQINQFLKNLGLIGGLLMVVYFGSGPISVDRRKDLA